MGVSRVELGDETLIDISGDTVTPETLAVGATAHDASGKKIDGKFDPSIFQTKEDESLNTDDKTVVGAINGINTNLITLMAWYDKENYVSLAFEPTPEMPKGYLPSNSGATFEMGSVNEVVYSWNFNKNPTSIIIGVVDDEGEFVIDKTIELNTEDTDYTAYHTSSNQETIEYALKAIYDGDYGDEEVSNTWRYTFMNRVYYGTKAVETISASDILTLSNKAFATSYKNSGFNLNDSSTSKYVWYCFPSRFETSKAPTFTVGGFEGAFIKSGTVSFTNSSGYKENYSVYRSTNKGVGDSTITVS